MARTPRNKGRATKKRDNGLLRLGGAWVNETKKGDEMLSIRLQMADAGGWSNADRETFMAVFESEDGVNVMAFENTKKKSQNSPDYNIYVSRDTLEEETE